MNRFITLVSCGERSKKTLWLCSPFLYAALAACFFTAANLRAASIGVNLGDTNNGSVNALSSAGVVPQTNWMNVGATSTPGLALSDNSGVPTTATLAYTGNLNPFIQNLSFVSGPDELLNNSYLASFGSSMTFTVSNVPYANYDLIAYVTTSQTGRTYTATLGSTTLFGISPNSSSAGYIDNAPTPFTYTSAVGTTSGTATPNGNYFRFNGLTSSTLSFTMASTNDLPTLTAFQIVQAIPEPSSIALAGMGVIGLALAGWKRQRSRRVA